MEESSSGSGTGIEKKDVIEGNVKKTSKKHTSSFLSLKKNFLPILMSPRVESIPRPYVLTAFIFVFIIACSGAVVTLLYYTYDERLDAATPLPVSGKSQGDCEPLLLRKDFRKSQNFPRNGESEREFVLTTLSFRVLRVELFDPSAFPLDNSEFIPLLGILADASDNFIELEGQAAVVAVREALEDLAESLNTLDFVQSAEVVDLEELEDLVDIFEQSDDEVEVEVEVDEESLLVSLVVVYQPTEGTECVMTLQMTENDGTDALLDGICFANVPEDELIEGLDVPEQVIFELRYTSTDEVDFFAQLSSYFINLHADVLEGDTLAETFLDPEELLEELGIDVDIDVGSLPIDLPGGVNIEQISEFIDEKDDETLVNELLASSNSFCKDRPELNVVDQFGLISGFGFALEGLITFIFALTLFQGKLGLEERLERNKGTRRLSHVDATKLDTEQPSLLEFDETDDSDNVIFDTELKRKIYQKNGDKTISSLDVQRAVFNPRCRSIPHALTVSTSTFLLFLGLSLGIAALYQYIELEERCVSTALLDASDELCEEKPIIRLFDFENSLNVSAAVTFGSLGFDHTYSVRSFSRLDFNDFGVTAELESDIIEACSEQNETVIVCLDRVLSPNGDPKDNAAVVKREYTLDSDNNEELEFDFEVEVEIDKNKMKLKLRSKFKQGTPVESQTFRYNVVSEVRKSVLNNELDVVSQANDLILTFLTATLFEADDIKEEVEGTQVRCCDLVSLNYFEYLGITLGYMAILEGLLTLLVALFLYSCGSAIGKW